MICDVCDGTGVLNAVRNRDGIWDTDDCWGCNGTGNAHLHDDSPHNPANYPTREDIA